MPRPYSPPLGFAGLLANQNDRLPHVYLNEKSESFCGIDPGLRSWHTSVIIGAVPRIRMCSACKELLLEEAILRTLWRINGRGTLDAIVKDVPGYELGAKQIERAAQRLVGKHRLECHVLPNDYPNRVEYWRPSIPAGACPHLMLLMDFTDSQGKKWYKLYQTGGGALFGFVSPDEALKESLRLHGTKRCPCWCQTCGRAMQERSIENPEWVCLTCHGDG